MKKKLIPILQLTAGLGLIALLFYRMDNKSDLLNALHDIADNWLYFVLALVSFLICITFCALRWKMILNAHNINISFPHTANLYFIGQFFNAFMPGAVGGDVIKAVYVAAEFPEKKAVAVSTIFIDRLIGLLSLLLFVCIVIILRLDFFMRYPETRVLALVIGAVSLGALVAMLLLFRRNLMQARFTASFIAAHPKIGRTIERVYNAFQDCLTHRGLMLRTTIVSMGNHIAMIIAALFIGLGLNIRTAQPDTPPAEMPPLSAAAFTAELENYLTLFPVIDGIAAIPVTPGGLGTREYTTQLLLGLPDFKVPATRAIPLSLLLYLTTMFWSLVGGVIYAVHVLRGGAKASRLRRALEQNGEDILC